MNQTNVVDNSIKIALRSDNAVGSLPGFAGTDVDEMSIPYLVGIPSFAAAASWQAAQVIGTSFLSVKLFPQTFPNNQSLVIAATTYNYASYSVMGYIANAFSFWRGSITLTFKFIKTEFHSGRCLIAFFPGRNNYLDANLTFANSQYVFREIVDLRTSSEVSITFPWTNLYPFLPTEDSYGTVKLFVLNPLVSPSNVTQNIDVILEVAGAPDFEFAVPRNTPLVPAVVSPQSGVSHATLRKVDSVMDNSTLDPAIEPSLYCVGERVQSIRQMIKRFSTMFIPGTSVTGALYVCPHVNYVPQIATTGGVRSTAGGRVDNLSYYAMMFRFWRGSTRVKYIDPSVQSPVITQTFYNTGTNYLVNGQTTAAIPNTNSACDQPTVTVPNLSGGVELEVPFYSQTHASHVYFVAGTMAVPREHTDQYPYLNLTQIGNISTNAVSYRAAGDDLALGFFIGTLPLVVTTIIT